MPKAMQIVREAPEVYACGGISHKNELMMQIYADVCNRAIKVSAYRQIPARGAAMFGAVAAGKSAGGFDDMRAAAPLGRVEKTYVPIPENVRRYDRLYAEYRRMHDLFGQENDVMKRLKQYKAEVR